VGYNHATNHLAGLWEDGMNFESTCEEEGCGEFRIGVYISVLSCSHFDLVVCSNNPREHRIVEGTTSSSEPHRVFSR
jgi:hypothetical protein